MGVRGLPCRFAVRFSLKACGSIFCKGAFTPCLGRTPSLVGGGSSAKVCGGIGLRVKAIRFDGTGVKFVRGFKGRVPGSSLRSGAPGRVKAVTSSVIRSGILVVGCGSGGLTVASFLPTRCRGLPTRRFRSRCKMVGLPLQVGKGAYGMLFSANSDPFRLVAARRET